MPSPAVAIVGAGIIGCMVAREIADRDTDARIVLVDQDMAGSGASRRSAGLHVPGGGTPRVRRMTAHSQDHYQRLQQQDPALPIHPLDMTVVAAESSAARLAATYLDEAGFSRTDRVPNAAVTIPAGAGAWTLQGAQYADVHALTQALARELRPYADVREGLQVTGVEADGDGAVVRLGSGETLHVGRAVLTPGPWVRHPAWEALLAPLGLRVKKIVALHVERRPEPQDHVVFFPDEDAFLLPLVHRGHWLFSYTCAEWDVDPDTPADGLSAGNLAEAHVCLARYAPALVEHTTSGRVFCDAYSPDREPQVRTLDDTGRIVFAGAANGSGYRLAPAIASEAADLLHLPSKVWSHS
jgi:glycine/D-amino acid oxidase-like deaminating enzyme